MTQRHHRIHVRRPACRNVTGQERRKPDQENSGQKDGTPLIEWQEIVVNEAQLKPH